MRALVLVALAGLAAPAAAEDRRLPLPGFDRIRVEGPIDATVTTGRGTSVAVSGDREALDAMRTRVDGRLLILAAGPGERVIARITTGNIEAAAASGAAKLSVDRVRADRARVTANGTAEVLVARVEGARVDAISAGSARLSLAGRTEAATLSARGAASLDGSRLDVGDLTLASETDGAMLATARRTARVNVAGDGSVTVGGRPQCTVRQTGSGTVVCGQTEAR